MSYLLLLPDVERSRDLLLRPRDRGVEARDDARDESRDGDSADGVVHRLTIADLGRFGEPGLAENGLLCDLTGSPFRLLALCDICTGCMAKFQNVSHKFTQKSTRFV